jgi:hypothetical protein
MSIQEMVANQGAKSAMVGYSNKGSGLVPVAPSYEWQTQYSATPASVSLAVGTFTSWLWQFANTDQSVVRDIVLQATMSTSDAVNSFTFFNPYMLIQQLKVYINGVSGGNITWLQDSYQVREAIESYLRDEVGQEDYQQELLRHVNNTSPLAGDTVADGAPIQVRWSLFKLVPALREVILNAGGVRSLQFDVTFASNQNTTLNNQYGKSNTVNNAYNSSITYSNLQFNVLYNVASDARILKPVTPNIYRFKNFYTSQIPNVSWNSVSVDNQLIQISTAFPQVNRFVQGLSIFIWDNTNSGSAYNSTTAGEFYSGGKYLTYKINSRGNAIIDLSQASVHLQQRRKYDADIWRSRSKRGKESPVNLMTQSDLMSKTWVANTYIDLSNVYNNHDGDNEAISGRDTLSNDVTVSLTCAQALSANCTIYALLHYDTLMLMKNGVLTPI